MSDTYTDDQIAELFAAANPIPVGGALDLHRSGDSRSVAPSVAPNDGGAVFDVSEAVAPIGDTRGERWWLVAGVAAAVALVVALAVTTTVDRGHAPADGPVTTEPQRATIPLEGADDDPDATAAFAIVESAFAAYNAGDMDTWAFWREAGSQTGADFAYDLASESRLQVERCEYRGVAEWDLRPRSEAEPMPTLTGHGFDCDATQTDVFMRAAGVELEMVYTWVVAEDLAMSSGGSNEDFTTRTSLMREYRNWLRANHPEVESRITYDLESLPTPEDVPAAAEHIDEFVAQSDTYPLTTPVRPGEYGGPLSSVPTEPAPTTAAEPGEPPQDATGNPLADIRSRLTNQGDTKLFQINADQPRYWRSVTLAQYDGSQFTLPDQRLSDVPSSGEDIEADDRVRIRQQIQVVAPGGKFVPAAPDARFANGSHADGDDFAIKHPTGTQDLIVDHPLESGDLITVDSYAVSATPDELRAAGSGGVPDPIYLELPDDMPDIVYETTEQLTADQATSYDKAMALQNWFRDPNEFTYSLEVQAGHGNDAIEQFLQRREGYCEQFAGTFAVMARAAGIPSRVAVGYTQGTLDASGWYSVIGKNSHAWPELWFEGVGWVPFEPTPGRGAPGAEAYTELAPAQDTSASDDGPLPTIP